MVSFVHEPAVLEQHQCCARSMCAFGVRAYAEQALAPIFRWGPESQQHRFSMSGAVPLVCATSSVLTAGSILKEGGRSTVAVPVTLMLPGFPQSPAMRELLGK